MRLMREIIYASNDGAVCVVVRVFWGLGAGGGGVTVFIDDKDREGINY